MLINRRTIRIEWGDCDPGGVVYFPRYFECFDACTRALFERAGLSKREMMKSYAMDGIPLVDMKARFLMPSRFGDDVLVESWVAKWGNSRFVVQHRLLKGNALAVECSETRVWVAHPKGDPKTFEARPIPQEVKERFAGIAEEESDENPLSDSTSR
ncbi:MAG TPA: thioesterase family protein [Terriglobales bacterium]|nr:thioesterase family protein [Terriglobales bacterium]